MDPRIIVFYDKWKHCQYGENMRIITGVDESYGRYEDKNKETKHRYTSCFVHFHDSKNKHNNHIIHYNIIFLMTNLILDVN